MKKQLCCLGLALFVCSTGWSDPDPSGKIKNVKAEEEPKDKNTIQKSDEYMAQFVQYLNRAMDLLRFQENDQKKTDDEAKANTKLILQILDVMTKDKGASRILGQENIDKLKEFSNHLNKKSDDAKEANVLVKEYKDKIVQIINAFNGNRKKYIEEALQKMDNNL